MSAVIESAAVLPKPLKVALQDALARFHAPDATIAEIRKDVQAKTAQCEKAKSAIDTHKAAEADVSRMEGELTTLLKSDFIGDGATDPQTIEQKKRGLEKARQRADTLRLARHAAEAALNEKLEPALQSAETTLQRARAQKDAAVDEARGILASVKADIARQVLEGPKSKLPLPPLLDLIADQIVIEREKAKRLTDTTFAIPRMAVPGVPPNGGFQWMNPIGFSDALLAEATSRVTAELAQLGFTAST